MAGKPYHGTNHRALGTPAILAAYNNPNYQCPRCGLTLEQGQQLWGKNAAWERGHIHDSTTAHSPLEYRAEHAHCNRSAGATLGNTRRTPRSRRWQQAT